ncbi:MAG: hypothetical protein DSM107014_11805 [Gomphosphaeria aponina SAG 52.96 = DSM 107014]|uniref:Uncharacterized protein n=1 Tax=Gomphosphaeria aponina SAG 52.96 = DSM 107014 TaxID=1521640 RepID=A0A941GRM3_9CHRO|nr:hypothetical protein [Gomphosphaeria aponina SAG 52.96 = DSM 107014]
MKRKYFKKIPLLLFLIFPLFPTSAQTQPVGCDGELWLQKSEIMATETAKGEVTIPNFWWAKEQYDPFGGKLVRDWLTYPEEKRIDLVVNREFWSLMDYLGRYRFVNQFGMVAREYGYSLRVFNQQEKCLAIYAYDNSSNPPKWEINLEPNGQNSLQFD